MTIIPDLYGHLCVYVCVCLCAVFECMVISRVSWVYLPTIRCTRVGVYTWIDTSSVLTRTNYPQSVSHYDYVTLRSRCSWHVRLSSALYVIGKGVPLFLSILLFPLCSMEYYSVTEPDCQQT